MLGKMLGQKYATITKLWVPTLAAWGGAVGVTVVNFTEWRVILDYVPYINGKFKTDD